MNRIETKLFFDYFYIQTELQTLLSRYKLQTYNLENMSHVTWQYKKKPMRYYAEVQFLIITEFWASKFEKEVTWLFTHFCPIEFSFLNWWSRDFKLLAFRLWCTFWQTSADSAIRILSGITVRYLSVKIKFKFEIRV